MGLTTWESGPEGRIYKKDVIVAKNYLSVEEIEQLERMVSSFFDYIERIIERRETFTMKAFIESVDKFLDFNLDFEPVLLSNLLSVIEKNKENVQFNLNSKLWFHNFIIELMEVIYGV